MPPQASLENSKTDLHSVSSIVSSLSNLASSTIAFKLNSEGNYDSGPKHYKIPKGSQDIPHPRTIFDILFRTIFIQVCAALAYALFLSILKQTSQRRGRRFGDLAGPWWTWPLLSVLLPELVIVQIGLWVICGCFPSIADTVGIGLPVRSQPCITQSKGRKTSVWSSILQSIALSIPLYYAGQAYKERLSMRYHQADYVGNLGIDHRNGWAVVSGLFCGAATILHSLILVLGNQHIKERPETRHSGVLSQLDSIAEQYEKEEEAGEDWTEKDGVGSHRRKSSDESQYVNSRSINLPTIKIASSSRSTQKSFITLFNNTEVVLTLYLTSVVHQIPMEATNRTSPLVAVISTPWCLSVIPIILLSVFTLPYAQRLIVWRAFVSSSRSGKAIVLFNLLRSVAILVLWLLVGTTILVQAWSDLSEIQDIRHQILQPWNYRWRVKDIFSHGDKDRVYMG